MNFVEREVRFVRDKKKRYPFFFLLTWNFTREEIGEESRWNPTSLPTMLTKRLCNRCNFSRRLQNFCRAERHRDRSLAWEIERQSWRTNEQMRRRRRSETTNTFCCMDDIHIHYFSLRVKASILEQCSYVYDACKYKISCVESRNIENQKRKKKKKWRNSSSETKRIFRHIFRESRGLLDA